MPACGSWRLKVLAWGGGQHYRLEISSPEDLRHYVAEKVPEILRGKETLKEKER